MTLVIESVRGTIYNHFPSPSEFNPLAAGPNRILNWTTELIVKDPNKVQTGVIGKIGPVIYIPKTMAEKSKLPLCQPANDGRDIWHSAEQVHYHASVTLIWISRLIRRSLDKEEKIREEHKERIDLCTKLLTQCQIVFGTYQSDILGNSMDPLKGKWWKREDTNNIEAALHTAKHIGLTGRYLIYLRNGQEVQAGIFIYQDSETAWFIEPPKGSPKLHSSLENLFPKPSQHFSKEHETQNLSKEHEDFVQNWKRVPFSWKDLHSHGFKLVEKVSEASPN